MDPLLDRVATQRLINQRLTRPGSRRPEDVVAWLGAVQAQEYAAARWGVGQRMAPSTDADVRRAVDGGRLLRTHVMRPTWHFVARNDIRWMLELTAPRVGRVMSHYFRRLELDARLRTRAAGIFERVLGDGPHLTRGDLGVHLARGGVAARGLRLAMLTMHAELEGVICSGAYRGRELTYALLADRAPRAPRLAREEALAELTRRFFTSHAPATVRDFVWWSGLTAADAKRGLDINRARHEAIDGRTYWSIRPRLRSAVRYPSFGAAAQVFLLPVYDEYLVAYRDRDAVPHGVALKATGPGGPLPFQNPLVIDGQVAGTWRPVVTSVEREASAERVAIKVIARPLKKAERRALAEAAARYGRFLDAPVTLLL
jgi:Winged helix DNA-binding domain